MFIPWDLDHSFGALEIIGTPESRLQHSINQPQIGAGKNRLIERMLEIPEIRQAYLTRVEQLLDTVFEQQKWLDQVDEMAAFVGPKLAEGRRVRMDAAIADGGFDERGYPLKAFVRKRHESIRDQLSGKSKGETNDFKELLDPKLIFRLIGWGLAIAVAGFFNFIAWIWASIAGFRFGTKWGLLNLLLYPLMPLAFGFLVSRKLGWRSAVMTLISVCLVIGFSIPFILTIRSF